MVSECDVRWQRNRQGVSKSADGSRTQLQYLFDTELIVS